MVGKYSTNEQEKWKVDCPKDDFPPPRIVSVVDDAANSEILSLLDCFSGYHQIWMKQEDEEKTSFITPFQTMCKQMQDSIFSAPMLTMLSNASTSEGRFGGLSSCTLDLETLETSS